MLPAMTSVDVVYTIPAGSIVHGKQVYCGLGTVLREQLVHEPYSKAELYAGLQNSAG